MSIATLAAATFTAIRTQNPEAVVPVIVGGVSVNGIRDTVTRTPGYADRGVDYATAGKVRVLASEIGSLAGVLEVTVAGTKAFISNHYTDGCGVVTTIDYSLQKPLT